MNACIFLCLQTNKWWWSLSFPHSPPPSTKNDKFRNCMQHFISQQIISTFYGQFHIYNFKVASLLNTHIQHHLASEWVYVRERDSRSTYGGGGKENLMKRKEKKSFMKKKLLKRKVENFMGWVIKWNVRDLK